jgi:hypothetical protein
MFRKQSRNSELVPFGRGKKYIHRRNCEQILEYYSFGNGHNIVGKSQLKTYH